MLLYLGWGRCRLRTWGSWDVLFSVERGVLDLAAGMPSMSRVLVTVHFLGFVLGYLALGLL